MALVAAVQPASALAPLAKVSVSSLLRLALCGPGQGAGAGPLACLFGAASQVTSPLLSGEPRLHLRRQLWSILVALDGHCLKRGWSRLAWGPEKLVRVTVCQVGPLASLDQRDLWRCLVSSKGWRLQAPGPRQPHQQVTMIPGCPRAPLQHCLWFSHPSPWAQLYEIRQPGQRPAMGDLFVSAGEWLKRTPAGGRTRPAPHCCYLMGTWGFELATLVCDDLTGSGGAWGRGSWLMLLELLQLLLSASWKHSLPR